MVRGFDRGYKRLPKQKEEVPPSEPSRRVNDEIPGDLEVLFVGDEQTKAQIMFAREALMFAQKAGLDLVEIAPNARPPVCKMVDYESMLRAEREKSRQMQQKLLKNTKKVSALKELRFTPTIQQHDFDVKLKRAREWLEVRELRFFLLSSLQTNFHQLRTTELG
uniref:Translation initiation factor 3 N-terminal domain-containing protein n=1 Tax=Erythrolobus madagascarensis TaxID=708628 RepID=A0A7S0T878_9RHOD|mmetsp:Transcript_4629/g.9935  ORF Transcript_4629/g.9935 Transcript_4629/m.9935 type:complete len:164 (+) Transcript_4629:2-493(+)